MFIFSISELHLSFAKYILWHDKNIFHFIIKEAQPLLASAIKSWNLHSSITSTWSSFELFTNHVFSPYILWGCFNNININNRENNFHCSTWTFLLRQCRYNGKVVSFLSWMRVKKLFEIWSEILNVIDSWLSSFVFSLIRYVEEETNCII